MPSVPWELHYDRRVPDAFLAHFVVGGVAASLAEYAKHAPFPVDLQMRHNPKTKADHASLYVGLTDVLTVSAHAKGLRLRPHSKITGKYAFDAALTSPVPVDALRNAWRSVEIYLDRVIPLAADAHSRKEGQVQAAASTFLSDRQVMVDREVAMHFRDEATKKRLMKEFTADVLDVVSTVRGIPGQKPTSFGGELDLLGIDQDGHLLAIEVKPADTGSIRWAAAQATVYAKILRGWLERRDSAPTPPHEVLNGMLDQRAKLGLGKLDRPQVPSAPEVHAMVAVPTGVSSSYLDGLRTVRDALESAGFPRVELFELTLAGRPDPLV